MTGDPDENEDILGFGNTDRVRPDRLRLRSDRLRLRLDRFALRLTRRPRFTAVASGLAAMALVAGAATYLPDAAHQVVPSAAAATRSRTTRPPLALGLPIQCTKAGLPVQVDARLAKLLKQLESQAPGIIPASSGPITIQVGTTTYGVIMEDPSTGKASCH